MFTPPSLTNTNAGSLSGSDDRSPTSTGLTGNGGNGWGDLGALSAAATVTVGVVLPTVTLTGILVCNELSVIGGSELED